jgi:hypothetical protein
MSSEQKHKMYDHEVPPPAMLWDKIAAQLDETALASRIQKIEVAPPPQAWQQIAATLGETALSSKLYNIEATPPAQVWNKIKTTLDAEHEAVIPDRRRLSPLLRYAAAAILIGAIAFGSVKIFTSQKSGGEIVDITRPAGINTPTPVKTEQPTNNNNENLPPAADKTTDLVAVVETKSSASRSEAASPRRIHPKAAEFLTDPVGLTKISQRSNPQETYRPLAYTKLEPSYTSIANRYIVLMTPDGNIIRMSKKLGPMLCCVSGEEQDEDCKDKLKKWREKLAASPASGSGSFLDVMTILNSLQENRL